MDDLNAPPSVEEFGKAINLSCGKASGNDGIPPEIIKAGRTSAVLVYLHGLLLQC